MKRVLIVMPNWIGDCLLASPSLRAVKESGKEFLAVLAEERVREVFRNNHFLDELIIFKDRRFFRPKVLKTLILRVSLLKIDTAILFKPSFTKSLICKLSGIKEIIGYKSKKISFINRKIPPPSGNIHKMDYYLNILEAIGIKTKKTPEFFVKEEYLQKAKKFLEGVSPERKKIVIHPKANWPLKMWPKKYFAELADRLIEELNSEVLITGSAEDEDLALSIYRLMRNTPHILAGKTSLGELAGLLKLVDLFISADTGIMHLAASLKVPLIALFGPTLPSISGPRGEGFIKVIHKEKDCFLPCYNLKCKDNLCMKKITPQQVLEEVKDFLITK
ncbi:MAG: glycosyltransferase family 9 protein [Candidatus Omnitrophica bacterium]|nr:glycosyltransferase family 9 protein [Candidatus Omnitrophota bacterium]